MLRLGVPKLYHCSPRLWGFPAERSGNYVANGRNEPRMGQPVQRERLRLVAGRDSVCVLLYTRAGLESSSPKPDPHQPERKVATC